MEKAPLTTILTLALLTGPFLAGGVSAESNEEQTGRSAWCTISLESMVLNNPPVSEVRRDHTPGTVDPVEPGTAFDLWIQDPTGVHDVVITFYRSDGTKLASVHNETLGGDRPTVPNGAAWGKVCVRATVMPFGGLTANPAFDWHYQDGFSS